MSHYEEQRALALLLRLPEHNRGNAFPAFVQTFSLTRKEQETVSLLSQDARVVKFGRSMMNVRWECVSKAMGLLSQFVPLDLIEFLYREKFEPAATRVETRHLVFSFLEFLMNDAECQSTLQAETPPFFSDLLKFELAQWKIRTQLKIRDGKLPFEVIDLDHDILAFLSLKKDSEVHSGPQPRRLSILITAQKEKDGSRFFEISNDTKDFLTQVKEGLTPTFTPDSYQDLVSLGILN